MNKVAKTLPLIISFGCFNVLPAVAEINKAYNLIEAENKTDDTITKYTYNWETNTFDPKYYNLEINPTEYGNINSYDDIKYYTYDSYGKITEGNKENAVFKYYVDSTRLADSQIYIDENSLIKNIDKDFTGFTTTAIDFSSLYLDSLDSVTGNFYNNTTTNGEAILSDRGRINSISGNFINNRNNSGSGGALKAYGADYIEGTFIGNSAYLSGGAIYANNAFLNTIEANFISNKAGYNGGAIYKKANMTSIKGDFIGNSAAVSGGAIYNIPYGTSLERLEGDFIKNTAGVSGGAIYSSDVIHNIKGDFISNSADGIMDTKGGAVYQAENSGYGMYFVNSSFIENYAKSLNGEAKGGAIYAHGKVNITAQDGYTSLIKGNYTESGGIKDDNAIYMAFGKNMELQDTTYSNDGNTQYATYAAEHPSLNLNAIDGGNIVIEDKIDGGKGGDIITITYEYENGKWVEKSQTSVKDTGYSINVNGDKTGAVVFNNRVDGGADMKLSNTNLVLGKNDTVLSGNDMTFTSGNFVMTNNSVGNTNFNNFTLSGTTTTSADVDLYNAKMDRITAQNYNIMGDSFLEVNGLNLLNDAKEDKTVILYADKELANNVKYTGANPVAYSPLWKYDVSYATHDDDLGYFTFNRGSDTNNYENFNPSALPAVISTNAGGYTTQMQVFEYAFKHSDAFMALPAFERMAVINGDKYALANSSDTTDVGYFSPLMTQYDTRGIWLKPYSSFENIPLKNGPKVSNISYGTLVGYDTNLKRFRNGFSGVLTGYLGYNGASQRYSGIDTYQNGGLVGLTGTLYKGNFFNATTISAGATVGSSDTMYGHEDYTMFMSGIGNKFGYDFEFKDGKFIFQPSLFLAYTFVNTFDYTNAAGLKIESDPLHAIQIAPGVKFFMNTKNGWQPYLRADMVWNLLDKNKVTAGDVRLPEMSIKPYVQYGVGVQKTFKNDTLTFFGQTLIQNGGRNGVSLNAGLRWAIGKIKNRG